MNKSNFLKGVFTCAVLIAGLNAGAAEAQDNSNALTEPSTSTIASPGYGGVSNAHGDSSAVSLRSGYNTGRTEMPDVPGCVGPATFCNLYAGS